MVLKEFELSRKYFLLARFIGVQYPPLEGELKGEEDCFLFGYLPLPAHRA
jgi:hypothetical protein